MADAEPPSDEVKALVNEYKAIVEQVLDRRGAGRIAESSVASANPSLVADTALWSPDLTTEQKIEILETVDVEARLRLVIGWVRETLAELTVRDEIAAEVSEGIDKQQREALLRRQLVAIQAELGESSDDGGFRERLAASGAPAPVRAEVDKEIDRLERTSEQSPEHGWIRTWIETVLDIPWGERRGVLRPRRRAVGARRRSRRARRREGAHRRVPRRAQAARRPRAVEAMPVAAPGGDPRPRRPSRCRQDVARRVDRPRPRSPVRTRVAVGGVRDEAEIRGHRRTYVGARPGRIVRAITEAGAMNPVLLLDEVDKTGSDYRGDPSSALLEVLDPAQNHTFRDHYLEVDLDLSDVLFLATANVLDTIPGPLLDRMELVRLDGYTEDEKVAIARDHLLPRLLTRTAIRGDEVQVDEEALREVLTGYTREAGVRELERQLGRVLRKVAARVAAGDVPIVVDVPIVTALLGRRRFRDEPAAHRGARRGHRARRHRHRRRRALHRGDLDGGRRRASRSPASSAT